MNINETIARIGQEPLILKLTTDNAGTTILDCAQKGLFTWIAVKILGFYFTNYCLSNVLSAIKDRFSTELNGESIRILNEKIQKYNDKIDGAYFFKGEKLVEFTAPVVQPAPVTTLVPVVLPTPVTTPAPAPTAVVQPAPVMQPPQATTPRSVKDSASAPVALAESETLPKTSLAQPEPLLQPVPIPAETLLQAVLQALLSHEEPVLQEVPTLVTPNELGVLQAVQLAPIEKAATPNAIVAAPNENLALQICKAAGWATLAGASSISTVVITGAAITAALGTAGGTLPLVAIASFVGLGGGYISQKAAFATVDSSKKAIRSLFPSWTEAQVEAAAKVIVEEGAKIVDEAGRTGTEAIQSAAAPIAELAASPALQLEDADANADADADADID